MASVPKVLWLPLQPPRPIRNSLVATWRYLTLMGLMVAACAASELYGVIKFVGWLRS